jgi:NAD(P)-dependent dehydrogenase (short-subunit alcohol dehydrogenase family)
MTRTALITGAGGGLAQATARLLAEAGWSLALVGRDRAALEAVQEDLTDHAPEPAESIKIVLVKADVSTGEGAVRAMETARELIEQPLTSLVNCAGGLVPGEPGAPSEHDRRRVAIANRDTAFLMLGAFLDQALTDHVRGSAVLVGSATPGDQRGFDDGGIADLVRSAAATYAAQGFRVNAVAPGPLPSPEVLRFFGNRDQGGTLAEQFPLGRWSDVLDTASAIRWLLSDEAAWVTGQVVPIEERRTTAPPVMAGRVIASV